MSSFIRKVSKLSHASSAMYGTSYNGMFKAMLNGESPQAYRERINIEQGKGRMVDGKYKAFSGDDKTHFQSAEEHKGDAFKDISLGSALGKYFGNSSFLENIRKKREEVTSTLLGGIKSLLGG